MRYQSATASAPEQITGIATSARAWLACLVQRIPSHGDAAVRALCHMLIASWITEAITDTNRAESAGFTEIAQRVAPLAERIRELQLC